MNKYREIIELVRKEDVALFVGAGCSISSGAPTGIQLAQKIWAHLEPDFKDENTHSSLQKVSEALILQNDNNRDTLNQVLFDNLAGLEPSAFHKLLRKIPHFRTIITTNFDSLIETAYTFDYFQTITNDHELATLKDNYIHLFKIHGDVSHLDQIIVSESDYRKFLQSPHNTLLWSKVISEFSSKHVVFVGYSADDQNILGLIDLIQKQLEGKAKKMFLISPSLSKTQEARLKALRINHIKGTGEEFLSFTFSALKESFGDDKYYGYCSNDTLTRFGLINGVSFSFFNDGKHTSITHLASYFNAPLDMQISFPTLTKDAFRSLNKIESNDIVKGFSVPLYELDQNGLSSFSLSANGLRLNGKNEIKRVLFGNVITDLNIAFIIKDPWLSCRCKSRKYVDEGVCHCLIHTPLFNIDFTIGPISAGRVSFSLAVSLNNDSFEDLDLAEKWATFLDSILNGAVFQLHVGTSILDNLKIDNSNQTPFYSLGVEYCKNLRAIEQARKQLFKKYDALSFDSYRLSKIIRSYCLHEPFYDKPRELYNSFNIIIDKQDLKTTEVYRAGLIKQIIGPIKLCEELYNIDDERVYFPRCKVSEIIEIDNEKMQINVVCLSDTICYEYCDKDEPEQLFKDV